MSSRLEVLATGPLTTVQDLGRSGLSDLGVGPSGAADRGAHLRANRLVGNDSRAATLEVTFGGLALRALDDVLVACAGAPCPGAPQDASVLLRASDVLKLGPPVSGLRTYVAVRGGLDVAPVLGSRSTDLLSGLGPPPVRAGDLLATGDAATDAPPTDQAPVRAPTAGAVRLRVLPGPRDDWFGAAGWELLVSAAWTASTDTDRVGLRLDGPALHRVRRDELPSEGVLSGALQVPADGVPVLFLADRPVTGGYPVIGYVVLDDLDAAAQVRPGQAVRLTG